MRFTSRAVAALAGLVLLSGCSFGGINDRPLPLAKGSGDDAIEVTVILDNAVNLVANSEVKYRDVTVGSVRSVDIDDEWHARITIGIDPSVEIPSDATATIAQKSLLGAEYLSLDADDSTEAEPLTSGMEIGLDRTGRYPETEEVLTAAAMLFNGGGLPQIATIAREVNGALGGRAGDVRALVRNVGQFTGTLDQQRGSIIKTFEQLNRLARNINDRSGVVARALRDLPKGAAVLSEERRSLVRALGAIDRLSTTTQRVLAPNSAPLAEVLENLRPITKLLAKTGPGLARLIENVTFPFPLTGSTRFLHADSANTDFRLRLDLGETINSYLGGTPFEGLLWSLLGEPAGSASTDAIQGGANPADAPSGTSDKGTASSTPDGNLGTPSHGILSLDQFLGLLGGS